MTGLRVASVVAGLLLVPWVTGAIAERADKQKPTEIESNRMHADDAKRMTVFTGKVQLRKGTLQLLSEHLVVREDAEGYQHASATGAPVRFRQRTDPRGDKPAVWIEGEALRIEFDDKEERVELFENAKVVRDRDEIRGDHIVFDQRTEAFTVNSGPAGQGGRVRAVLQPKSPAEPAPQKQ